MGGRAVTHAELRTRVAEQERIFAAHGVGPGTTVALHTLPSFTTLWTLFGLWARGAQVALFDSRLKRAEIDTLLALTEPEVFVSFDGPGRVLSPFRDECEVVVRRRRGGRPAATPHVLVQFSSGSTGAPKVIGRTAGALLAEIDRFAAIDDMPGRGDTVLLLNSIIHSLGLVGGVLHGLNAGVRIVFSRSAQPRGVLDVVHGEQADALFGVPAHFALLAATTDAAVPPRLRLAVSGGELLAAEVFTRFRDRFGVRIGQAYGMTEVGIIAADPAGRHDPPAVGPAVAGLRVRAEAGELHVHTGESPYLLDDGVARFRDGWLRTYDAGAVDPVSGVLTVGGRADSVVVVGGLKVDLGEIESVLRSHEEITDAVVVRSDVIEAHVATAAALSADELTSWCRDRLAHYKIPRRFRVVADLPRTANGKLIRNHELLRGAYSAAHA
ncbi:hypothetical protein GCM10022222_58990 [Amycolatopsis ultiminotia]|uniref:Uncharacterized protein n=1 Tax=Amycolatopsis ultiminotia TaxID=543629 RepID=A0ABP6XI75_9PSEU